MAELTIRLRYNLATGKKDILIDLLSDDDALPIEHEQQHRQIVEQLLGRGLLQPDELGEVVVTRGASAPARQQLETDDPSAEPIPQS